MIVPTRSHAKLDSSARPMWSATSFSRAHVLGSRSVHLSTSRTGTTSTWPGRIGAIVRNATTSSSRHTNLPGNSPVMILVNTEPLMAGTLPDTTATLTGVAAPKHQLIHKPTEEGLGEMSVDRLVTLPNAITTVRALCIPLFLWLLFGRDSWGWAGFTLGLLGSTDWVDGYVARRFNQTSNFGKMYDPTVDRLLLVVGIVSVIAVGAAPGWFSWTVLVREVILSVFVIAITALGAKRMDVTWIGKCGAFANMGAFPAFLLAGESTFRPAVQTGWRVFAYLLAIPGLVFSMIAFGQYLVRGREALAEGRSEASAIR